MPRYNTQFELSLEDMELIETALRETKTRHSAKALADDETAEHDTRVKQIQGVLGKLHNQKQFYRPRTGAYISG